MASRSNTVHPHPPVPARALALAVRESLGGRSDPAARRVLRLDLEAVCGHYLALVESSGLGPVEDAESAAEDLLAELNARPPAQIQSVEVGWESGSLTNVMMAAEGAWPLMNCRKAVLGTRRALSREEAEHWILREAAAPLPPMRRVTVTHEYLVPTSAAPDPYWAGEHETGRELLDRLEDARDKVEGPDAADVIPRVRVYAARTLHVAGRDVPLDRGRLVDLTREAERLVRRLDPPTTADRTPFEAMVWLLLSGEWPRAGLQAVASFGLNGGGSGFLAPRVDITVREPEATAPFVKDLYQRLRRAAGLGGRGPNIPLSTELLGIAAVSVLHEQNLRKGDTGFLDAARERWMRLAPSYGLDPATCPSKSAAHMRLQRLENAYAKFALRHSSGTPPRLFQGGLSNWHWPRAETLSVTEVAVEHD